MALCKHQNGNSHTILKVACTAIQGYMQHTPVAKCKIYDLCLPVYRPTEEQYEKWKNNFKESADIYKVCKYCTSYTPKK